MFDSVTESVGCSVHGISQTRILEWLPFPSPGDLPNPGTESMSPGLAGRSFTTESPMYALQLRISQGLST